MFGCEGRRHANDFVIAPVGGCFRNVEGNGGFVRQWVCGGLKRTECSVSSGNCAVGTDREVLVSLVGTTEAVSRR